MFFGEEIVDEFYFIEGVLVKLGVFLIEVWEWFDCMGIMICDVLFFKLYREFENMWEVLKWVEDE